VIKAHKIRLNPTPEQEHYFWQCAGVARFAWNWALDKYNQRKAEGQTVKIISKGDCLKSEFARLKKTDYPWLGDVQSYAYQQAFLDLKKAISRYFELKKTGKLIPPLEWKPRKDGKPFGWPRFKSRTKSNPSFYLANNGGIAVEGHWAKIQKCPGLVNMTESLRFDGRIMGARVNYRAGHWWLSIQVEMEHEPPIHEGPAVGIDLGIKYLAVTSDGEPFANPKAYEKAQKKLRRLQRKLDRQRRVNNPNNYNENGTVKKGVTEWHKSQAMLETERQIAKLHFRVASVRNETAHEMTTQIAKEYGFIGVENLNIKGMVKNRRLAKAVSDAAMSEKRRQLEYKAIWNGGRVVVVDQWFASSKICNTCGWVNVNLKLSDREWVCGDCGTINHRDENAAKNIRNEALRIAGL